MSLPYEDALKNGRQEEALKQIFDSIEEEPEVEVHYINGGNLLHSFGRDEEAEQFLQKAIDLNSQSTSAFYSLANIYYNHERYEEAIRLYLIAYSRNEKDADLNFMLAMSYINTQQPKAALQFFEVAYQEKPDDIDICFQYGLLCCQLSLYDPAEKLLTKVVDKTQHADAQYNLGLLKLVRDDDKVQAAEHFQKAIVVQKDHHLAHHALKKISE